MKGTMDLEGSARSILTAAYCVHAELTSRRALASCYSCCMHSCGLCQLTSYLLINQKISEKSETVDLWAMSARMCTQSFVALCCILRKSYGFLDLGEQSNNQSGFLGPTFRVQKHTNNITKSKPTGLCTSYTCKKCSCVCVRMILYNCSRQYSSEPTLCIRGKLTNL